jgi:hypothetical protein
MKREKENRSTTPELAPDMKLYFGEMFDIMRYQAYILDMAGISMGRSTIDLVRELLVTSVEKIGKLDATDEIWKKEGWELFAETKRKIDTGEIIPKSTLPEKYKKLFQDIRTLYFFSEEKVKERGEYGSSYEGTLVGIPVELIANMLDRIVDPKRAKDKWEEIKGDKNKIREFYHRTKWQIQDLPQS